MAAVLPRALELPIGATVGAAAREPVEAPPYRIRESGLAELSRGESESS